MNPIEEDHQRRKKEMIKEPKFLDQYSSACGCTFKRYQGFAHYSDQTYEYEERIWCKKHKTEEKKLKQEKWREDIRKEAEELFCFFCGKILGYVYRYEYNQESDYGICPTCKHKK